MSSYSVNRIDRTTAVTDGRRLRHRVLMLLMPLLLSACGFHLRGVADFPPGVSSVYIQADDRYSPFYRELVATIRRNGLGPARDPVSADTIVRVLSDETGRRALTVSARNIPREFEVYYVVNYAVTIDGAEVVAPQRLLLTRDYTYDEKQVLGKAKEEEVLRRALAKDLVGLLVRTINAAE